MGVGGVVVVVGGEEGSQEGVLKGEGERARRWVREVGMKGGGVWMRRDEVEM